MTKQGGINMTFYKDGRKFDYVEVIESLSSMSKQNVLSQLEQEEINKLYVRIFDSTKEVVTNYLEKLEYKVVGIRQSFLTLVKLKVIGHFEVWDKAIMLYEEIEKNYKSSNEIASFMSHEFLEAMKELNQGIESKQKTK